jgi:hypothetical protein
MLARPRLNFRLQSVPGHGISPVLVEG